MAKEKTTTETGAVTVQFLQGMASMENNRNKGDVLAVAAAEAERLIEKGFAKRVAIGSKAAKEPPKDPDAE